MLRVVAECVAWLLTWGLHGSGGVLPVAHWARWWWGGPGLDQFFQVSCSLSTEGGRLSGIILLSRCRHLSRLMRS